MITKVIQRNIRTLHTLSNIKSGWEAVIGIEVHAQINTKTKLFSGTHTHTYILYVELTRYIDSSTSYNDHVNTHVSVIDAAFPGVQPVRMKTCFLLLLLIVFRD